jgi:hypothetical protein
MSGNRFTGISDGDRPGEALCEIRGAGIPDERPGTDVLAARLQLDGPFRFDHAGEAVAANAPVGDVTKEPLDDVQPRRAGPSEVRRGFDRKPEKPGQRRAPGTPVT